MKKESFELGFEIRKGGRFRRLAGKEFQTVGSMKLKERAPTYLRVRLWIFKSFSFDDRRVREI